MNIKDQNIIYKNICIIEREIITESFISAYMREYSLHMNASQLSNNNIIFIVMLMLMVKQKFNFNNNMFEI